MDINSKEDKKKFATVMFPFGKIYDLSLDNEAIQKFWFMALSDLSIEELSKAVMLYIKSPDFGSFKPKPADIIKMIEGTSVDKSFSAWSKVEGAMRRVGSYQTVVFDDPTIHRIISDMGGWVELCQKEEKELPFLSKEFCARYKGFCSRREIPAHPRKLYGITDRVNGANGFIEESDPVMIGDGKVALDVLAGKMQPDGISFLGVKMQIAEKN